MKDMTSSGKVTSLSYEDFQEPENNKAAVVEPAAAPAASGGFLWRMGSGMVNVTKGAVGGTVGLGVGAVKLVANTSYGVVAKTAEVGKNATVGVAHKSYDVVAGSVNAVTSRLPVVPIPAMPTRKASKDKED